MEGVVLEGVAPVCSFRSERAARYCGLDVARVVDGHNCRWVDTIITVTEWHAMAPMR